MRFADWVKVVRRKLDRYQLLLVPVVKCGGVRRSAIFYVLDVDTRSLGNN